MNCRRAALPRLAVLAVSTLALASCGDAEPGGLAGATTVAPSETTTAYAAGIEREGLLEAVERTVLDQLLEYPTSSQAQVTSQVITIPPGLETGWHGHEAPLVVYILEGELEVTYRTDAGEVTKTYRAGDSIVEAVGTIHNGANRTDSPVRLFSVNIGAEGVKNTFTL
ncbi:MAG: cupin domain-containing protein [Ilumatobacteraceae bacterium]